MKQLIDFLNESLVSKHDINSLKKENIIAIRYYVSERMKASKKQYSIDVYIDDSYVNNNLTNYDYKMESLVFKTFDEAMDFINKIVDETWKKYETDLSKSTKVIYQNEKYPNFKKFNMFVY